MKYTKLKHFLMIPLSVATIPFMSLTTGCSKNDDGTNIPHITKFEVQISRIEPQQKLANQISIEVFYQTHIYFDQLIHEEPDGWVWETNHIYQESSFIEFKYTDEYNKWMEVSKNNHKTISTIIGPLGIENTITFTFNYDIYYKIEYQGSTAWEALRSLTWVNKPKAINIVLTPN